MPASKALASESDTLSLACESGFIWRSFYNARGSPIACVKDIRPGDHLLLGYRGGGAVRLLARFRVGRPDKPIDASLVFGEIPAVWVDEFRRHGYADDPKLGVLVGIFVEECEPLAGQLPYRNQNSLSRLESDMPLGAFAPVVPASPVAATERPVFPPQVVRAVPEPPSTLTARDGVHVGIDVGGRREKGFDLCITEWVDGVLRTVRWKRLPHATPLPPTSTLRALVRHGDFAGLAAATQSSASATAAALWRQIELLSATGIHIDSPSAFSRNRLGHGRLCEKRSLTGVCFQSTPSIACSSEHGGDWGWLVYGMIAFAACLHCGLTNADWMTALESGTFSRCDSAGIVLRECFPTATVSVLRAQKREADLEHPLAPQSTLPEVQAVLRYLKHGVKGVKRPGRYAVRPCRLTRCGLGCLATRCVGISGGAELGCGGQSMERSRGRRATGRLVLVRGVKTATPSSDKMTRISNRADRPRPEVDRRERGPARMLLGAFFGP